MVDSTDPLSLKEELEFSINEIEFLENKGLIKIENTNTLFENIIPNEELGLISLPNDYVLKDKSKTVSQNDIKNELLTQMHLDNIQSNLNARKICSKLNEKDIFNIKPILEVRMENYPHFPDFSSSFENKFSKTTDIVNLILRKTPIIDNIVSWEEIIDFRANKDLNVSRLGIINWISEMGNSNLTVYEIEQKLDYLLAQYEESLRKAKIKYNVGSTELVVTTSLMVLENIVKLNWSKAAKSLFELKRQSVDLLIGETLFPGREVAYLSKVRELNK